MNETIIVMGGSFNPPTIAHQRLLLGAVDALGADKGIFVPSSHTYVSIKMRRAKRPKEVLPEQIRLEMLEAMAADDPRLEVEDCEFYRTEKGYTYESMESIQEKYPDARLFFLAGGDKVSVISRWHRIRKFLDRFQILVVKRDGDDPETGLQENPFLCEHLDRFRIIPAPDGLDGISSSAVRDMLRDGESGAEEMLHPKVWEILQRNGGVRKMTINEFRGEYFFLSNFYEAPVEYRGLRYGSNEAAFQAQKCMTEAEKEMFTQLRPSDAKKKGRRVQLRPDWEKVKVGIMREIVRAKFAQNEGLRALLLATGDAVLEEGNTWNDTFWGIHLKNGQGQNHLGRILMQVRKELSEQ